MRVDSATHAYAGFCKGCGNMAAIMGIHEGLESDTADFVAEIVRHGGRVERVTVEEARQGFEPCACKSRAELPL